jgi:PIN domain nuclease of toxin-antitoxin system
VNALLLDTHVWVWYAEGSTERLEAAAVRRLDAARRSGGLLVSAISVWEIGMHAARGRIQLAVPLRDWVDRALAVPGMGLVTLDSTIAAESTSLPGEPQGDPADRFLIATARIREVPLATRDERILQYAKRGFLRAVRI